MKRFGLAVLVLSIVVLVMVQETEAGSCAVVQPAAVVQPVYYAAQPPALVLGIFVPTPSYTVGLSAVDPAAGDRLEAILKRLEVIENKLTAPSAPANALPLQQSSTPIGAANCVKCHTAPLPSSGFTFDFEKLSAADKALCAEKILSGDMPPKGAVPKEKRRALLAEILK